MPLRNSYRFAGFPFAAFAVLFFGGLVFATVSTQAVQHAKEAANAANCKNNLHNLALAVHLYHEAHEELPPFTFSNTEGYGSWALAITPYLEDEKTYDAFVKYEATNSETNLPIVSKYRNKVWQCPSRRSEAAYDFRKDWATNPTGATFEDAMPTDYVAAHTADAMMWSWQANGLIVNPRTSASETQPLPNSVTSFASVTDGTSNTALLGEKHMIKEWLGQPLSGEGANDGIDVPVLMATQGPGFVRVAGDETAFGTVALAPSPDYGNDIDPLAVMMFGSWHKDVTHFVNADAAVREMVNSADAKVLKYYLQRNDGETITFPDAAKRDR